MARDWKKVLADGETKHVDFKGARAWDRPGRESLVEAIIAMSNVRDGGTVVVGVKEDTNKAHVPDPLTPHQLATFDPTPVGTYVNSFVDPPIRLKIVKDSIAVGALDIVCIEVDEFATAPHICNKPGPMNGGKPVFVPGQILIRTEQCESRPVRTPEEMRELVNLALLKRRDSLLREVSEIMNGRSPDSSTRPAEVHAAALATWEAERQTWYAPLQAAGHAATFECELLPIGETPLLTHADLTQRVQAATVMWMARTSR